MSTEPLYTPEILRLAGSLPIGSLDAPDGQSDVRAVTCGSRIRAAVRVADGRVVALSQDVQACAFGQASAALVQAAAAGRSQSEIEDARGDLVDWLQGRRDDPGTWPDIAALAPARDRTGRHGAMLLPFDAVLAALRDAGA